MMKDSFKKEIIKCIVKIFGITSVSLIIIRSFYLLRWDKVAILTAIIAIFIMFRVTIKFCKRFIKEMRKIKNGQ